MIYTEGSMRVVCGMLFTEYIRCCFVCGMLSTEDIIKCFACRKLYTEDSIPYTILNMLSSVDSR